MFVRSSKILRDTRGKRKKRDFHSPLNFYYLDLISLTKCLNSYRASRFASLEKRTYVSDSSFTLPYVISFTRSFPNGSLCDFSFRPENCSSLEYRISICPIFPALIIVNFELIDTIDRRLRLDPLAIGT